MSMCTDEFNRRKFKIQDNAIREILNLLHSNFFDPMERQDARKILNTYNESLKDLHDESIRRSD